MKLLIVRHGESNGNATGDYSTEVHDRLSPRGQAQADALVERLMAFEFDRIIVSPLQRALETAAPYLRAAGRRAEVWPEIAEACYQTPRQTPGEMWRTETAYVPAEIADLFVFRDGRPVRPLEAETFAESMCRLIQAWERLAQLADGPTESVLMVTHGIFLRESFQRILAPDVPVDLDLRNCGMTCLTFNGRWTMDSCNG